MGISVHLTFLVFFYSTTLLTSYFYPLLLGVTNALGLSPKMALIRKVESLATSFTSVNFVKNVLGNKTTNVVILLSEISTGRLILITVEASLLDL